MFRVKPTEYNLVNASSVTQTGPTPGTLKYILHLIARCSVTLSEAGKQILSD